MCKCSRSYTRNILAIPFLYILLRRQLAAGYEQSDLSLQDYLDFWINEYKNGSVRKNTLLLHQNNNKNHIIPFFKTSFYEMEANYVPKFYKPY
ncbi:hypothetical protein [Paenibacillus amylolyticus]|uniref:hypothetical protein n=1 Tax=Paenibacillus amylolyticus TaxID=1451 RepID=UPI003394356A